MPSAKDLQRFAALFDVGLHKDDVLKEIGGNDIIPWFEYVPIDSRVYFHCAGIIDHLLANFSLINMPLLCCLVPHRHFPLFSCVQSLESLLMSWADL